MLNPVHLRDLLVDPASHPRGQSHLSAASGLVRAGRWHYVVADDEHHLGMFQPGANAAPLQLRRLVPGELPHDAGKRKKRKPDLEALALLPAFANHAHGALLALGSGSRPTRERGFLVGLDSEGSLSGDTVDVDLAAWYAPLRTSFADLNIEGAFVAGDRLHLLQRGNKGDARNACIEYSLAELHDWLDGRRGAPPVVQRIVPLALPALDGVPLGLTDGAACPGGGWLFSAVAEDTGDSYLDGACAGSVLGWVDRDGSVLRLERLEGAPKVEGIALDGDRRLLMVTDADDPARASRLLAVELA
jgi:hypothetical protein